jgi:hypothetical protein
MAQLMVRRLTAVCTPRTPAAVPGRCTGNAGVREFFDNASRNNIALFLSVITIGELRQGVENIPHRGNSAGRA